MKIDLTLTLRLTREAHETPENFSLAYRNFRDQIESSLAAGQNLELPPTTVCRWLLVLAAPSPATIPVEGTNHVEVSHLVGPEPVGSAPGAHRATGENHLEPSEQAVDPTGTGANDRPGI